MEVIVVGSGPSAHLAAACFQQRGYSATVVRRPAESYSDCSVFLPLSALPEFDLSNAISYSKVSQLEFLYREKRVVVEIPEEAHLAGFSRSELSGLLAGRLADQGGKVREGQFVRVEQEGSRLTVSYRPPDGPAKTLIGDLLLFCAEWESLETDFPPAHAETHLPLFLVTMRLPDSTVEHPLSIDLDVRTGDGGLGFRLPRPGLSTAGVTGSLAGGNLVRTALFEALSADNERWSGAGSIREIDTRIPVRPSRNLFDGRVALVAHSAGMVNPLFGLGALPALVSAKEVAASWDSENPEYGFDRYRQQIRDSFGGIIAAGENFRQKFLTSAGGCERLFSLLNHREAQVYLARLIADVDPGPWTASLWGLDKYHGLFG